MNISRVKPNGDCTIFATMQELEDMRSVFGIAVGVARKRHKDSPKFLRAIERMNRQLWKVGKDNEKRVSKSSSRKSN